MSDAQARPPATARVVVLGAGPSGLACAATCQDAVVLEAGPRVAARQRDDADGVLTGVGGAGLYSDGKFSFAPAASGLWQLDDAPRLADACDWARALLDAHGLHNAPLGLDPHPPDARPFEAATGAVYKKYPSVYLGLRERLALIAALEDALGARLVTGCRVVSARVLAGGQGGVAVAWRSGEAAGEIVADKVVFAGGRFGPALALSMGAPTRFMRVEVGVRIEGPREHPLFLALRRMGGIDPKLILTRGRRQWRTFCCCHGGELVLARWDDLLVYSGRADGAQTTRSNIGFNARFLDPNDAPGMAELARIAPFDLPLLQKRSPTRDQALTDALGPHAGAALAEGLAWLGDELPALWEAPGLRLLGPTIEGVGAYPDTDATLRVPGMPAHVVGDSCGRFRGLVAALVSGAYVGRALAGS